MRISDEMIRELHWWLENLPNLHKPILPSKPDLTVYSDASLPGWGVHIPDIGLRFGGRWDMQEQEEYIYYLRLLAILYALQSACSNFVQCHI